MSLETLDRFRKAGKTNWRKFIEKKLHIISDAGAVAPFGEARFAGCTAGDPSGFSPSQIKILDAVEQAKKDMKALWLLVLKGRQRGVSTISAAINFTDTYCGENTKCMVAAHLKDNTDDLAEKYRLFHSYLPSEVRMPLDKDNELKMVWKHNNSQIILGTAGNLNIGHGRTLRRVHLSELSRFPDLLGFLNGFNEAVSKYWDTLVIGESTAFGANNPMYDLWQEAVKGRNLWTPLFLNWMEDPDAQLPPFRSDLEQDALLERIYSEFPELKDRAAHYGMTARQIGWYHGRLLSKNGDMLECQQDYPCDPEEAFIASGTPFFPPSITQEYLMLSRPGTLYDPTIPFSNFQNLQRAGDLRRNKDTYLEVWYPPEKGRKYVIACDSAEGIQGRDNSAAYVVDMLTRNVVAELHGIIEPHPLCYMLVSLARMYNEAIIAPEAHGAGTALVAILKQSGHFKLYYKRKVGTFGFEVTPDVGWDTNVQTRPILFAEAKRIYRERKGDKDFIPSQSLLEEIRMFVIKDFTGRGAAAASAHDDRVMAWSIAQMVCLQEMGQGGIIINPSHRATISTSREPSPQDIVAMLHDPLWTGQSYNDFYGERKTW